ncbi:D-methionine transport system ATP-binding protein [Faunimonas pinastri]|uniref:Cell division ATP-binding protein FtsE n=1 Tax=Faunimonas pinastri TaxID=1855383 RepID=A0A1H9PC82_9HYPH|nr:methionine ABC transporter ATP-binding protein [Faunimonas pinastri]SER45781.1 D-methionine transport system ATP-binding protein [Faunimonas pinastri]
MNAPAGQRLEGPGLAAHIAQEPAIAFRNVSKSFADAGGAAKVTALDALDFAVPRSSITCIIGRSGAGKSTLIRLVNGLEKPTSGSVIVDGTDVSALSESALRPVRRSIGMIFQHFNLLTSRTVYDNVALPLEIAGVNRRAIEAKVMPLLDLVGLADKSRRYPSELSGGQKQRVGIARALATDPKVLLSDEATSALDPETTRSILGLLKRINAELGLTVLLITHEMQVVKQVADRVAVIDGGRIVEEGDTYSVFTRPQHPTTRTLLADVVGVHLPAFVTSRLSPEPKPGADAVVKVIFTGPNATEPVLAKLGETMGLHLNILAGAVDEISGRPYGTLVVSMDAGPETLARARGFIHDLGLETEVLGYVV